MPTADELLAQVPERDLEAFADAMVRLLLSAKARLDAEATEAAEHDTSDVA
jgi:hypothetical protein